MFRGGQRAEWEGGPGLVGPVRHGMFVGLKGSARERTFPGFLREELKEVRPVRACSLFRKMLGITCLFVAGVSLEARGLVLRVRPSWKAPRCGNCGRKGPGYDQSGVRYWRHLALGRYMLWLAYAPRRVECRKCGVRTEGVPWAALDSDYTWDFEEMTAFLSQVTDRTMVSEMLNIGWRTVGGIAERVVERKLDPGRLDGVKFIGVDEFSYRKRHRYITVVVDHERGRVIWAKEGRSAEVLSEFFKLLGPERCREIQAATIDMSSGYEKAIREWLPEADVVFDRFHVQRLGSEAVDEIRREIVREAGVDDPAGKAVKKTRFVLLKNSWDLSRREKEKLSAVQRANKGLYRAYLLKETLADALDYKQPARAEEALSAWLAWASRSKLGPFIRVARTIRRHFDGVLAYVRTRLTNGLVEGINNKLRMVARRAFGFHSAGALIGMLFLTCGGIVLDPPIPRTKVYPLL